MGSPARLPGRKRFSEIYREGKTWSNSLLVVKALPNGVECARIGIAVGRRLGKAVERNRLRRRLREIVRATEMDSGWDLLVIARPPAASTGFQGLREAVAELLRRARLGEGN